MPPVVMSRARVAQAAPLGAVDSDVPVRVLVGPDLFLRREAIAHWRTRWQPGGAPDAASSRFDLAEHALSDVLAAAASGSLFSPRQFIVAQGLEAVPAKEHGPLLAYLDSPCPTTFLVLAAGKLDGRSKLAQALSQRRLIDHLEPPAPHALVGYLMARARAQHMALTPGAAALLAERIGPDVGLLQQSLEKVALSVAGPGGDARPIERADVDAMVVPTREASVFALTDAIGQGPWSKASCALADLLHGGEEPLVILAMLIRQVRLLLAAQQAPKTLGVPAFVAKTLLRQAGRLPRRALRAALADLQACDLALKRSRLPPAVALERAIWPLVATAERGPA